MTIPVDELLADHRGCHSRFQMDHFITVNVGRTLYGCYTQALREMHARVQAIEGIELELAALRLKAERLTRLRRWTGFTHLRRCRIELDSVANTLRMTQLLRDLADSQYERDRFHQQASALKTELGEMTDDDRERLDAETRVIRLRYRVALELRTTGNVAQNTIDLVLSLPREPRDGILNLLGDKDSWVEWADEHVPTIGLPVSAPGLFEGIMALEIAERQSVAADCLTQRTPTPCRS